MSVILQLFLLDIAMKATKEVKIPRENVIADSATGFIDVNDLISKG
jgi:hypothetical protein